MTSTDPAAEISELSSTLDSVAAVLNPDAMSKEADRLREEAGDPGLWADQERAQAVTRRLSYLEGELARLMEMAPVEDVEPQDCDVLRIVASGRDKGQRVEITNQIVVLPYPRWGISAGALDTGTPLAIAGHMLATGKITRRGAFGPEMCVPVELFFQELARFDMHVTETRTVMVS